MIQEIHDPGLGERLGQSLGMALGRGVKGYVQGRERKLDLEREREKEEREYIKPGVWERAGYTPEQAQFLSNFKRSEAIGLAGRLMPGMQPQQMQQQPLMQRMALEGQQPLMPNLGQGPSFKEQAMQQILNPINLPGAGDFISSQVMPKQQGTRIPQQTEQQLGLQQPSAMSIAQQLRESSPEKFEKQQLALGKKNEPIYKAIDKSRTQGQEIIDKATQMLNLLNSGEVTSGGFGIPYVSRYFQNEQTRLFEDVGRDLATTRAGLSRGAVTDFKQKRQEEIKPNLTDSTEVQRQKILNLLHDGQLLTQESKILDHIMEKTGGVEPKNLRYLMEQERKKLNQPLPKGAQEGDIVEDDKTGELFIVRNGSLDYYEV